MVKKSIWICLNSLWWMSVCNLIRPRIVMEYNMIYMRNSCHRLWLEQNLY
jgi:hypothetical protein